MTFKKLAEYLESNRIDLNNYPEKDFAVQVLGLGDIYSVPGGLKENVYMYKQDAWVKQVEGSDLAHDYLDEYSRRVYEGKQLPLLVDVLNCSHGCNMGTGTEKKLDLTEMDQKMHAFKLQNRGKFKSKPTKLLAYFDKQLKLEDFERVYTPETVDAFKEPSGNLGKERRDIPYSPVAP